VEESQTADSRERDSRPFRTPRSKRCRLFPRQKRTTFILLLIDVSVVVFLVCALEPLITLLARNEELFSPRLTLHDVGPAPSPTLGAKHKIPRILHQTTPNDTIPAKWVESQRSCREAYSDYEYKVRCRSIHTLYPPRCWLLQQSSRRRLVSNSQSFSSDELPSRVILFAHQGV
jgi:hypothetical protein